MKPMNIAFFSILIYLGVSCNKELPPVKTDPCQEIPCDTNKLMGKLDTLWTAPLPDNQFGIITDDIYFHNDKIIIIASTNENAYVTSFEEKTGENNWVWQEVKVSHFPSSYIHNSSNRLIVHNRKKMAQIDLSTGATVKLFEQLIGGTSNPYGHLFDDFYYYSQTQSNQAVTNLVRSHIDNFNTWETKYELKAIDVNNNQPNIQSYNLWVNPESGDSILIFQHRMAFPNRVDIVAYNLNTKVIEWKHEDLTKNGNSNHQQIFLHDNKAYFGGSLTFYCFDMFTGDILWEHDDPNNQTTFMIDKTIYAKSIDAIIVKDGGGLYAFDPNTGKQRWYNSDAGISSVGSGSPSYHDGMIYYTANALLYAVRASSGTVLWSERSSKIPMGNTSFGGDVAIDPDRRVLYVTNENTLFAIKLFEP